MSILIVSDESKSLSYHSPMENSSPSWKHWGQRLRLHVREHRQKWTTIAEAMDQSEGALRHWCNGTREINLSDFFRLCEITCADPYLILFGTPALSPEQSRKLGETVAAMMHHDTATNLAYAKFSRNLQRASPTMQQNVKRKSYTKAAKHKP